ncbi:hypothetical protein ABE073_04140 [Lederbergia citrisecunda]|uniref:hypothetical protein n=1 Tax=Lederbergia citrisecunda TaxID=2833583 RepID=UPI003D2B25B7
MKEINFDKMNISEAQKEQLKLSLKLSKLEMKYIHKDKEGNIYRTGYNNNLKKIITIKNFECGYWDSNFKGNIETVKNLELLHEF